MSQPQLTPADLERFCRYLYDRTGMVYGESKRYYVERRLADRMRAVRDTNFAAYFTRLRADAAELSAFINAFTVNETYFYREDHQLRCLSSDLLPELVRGKSAGDKVRIWSFPCSTGEEAYSIAIWLLETWPMVDAYHVEIVGSDVDTAALEQARIGHYGERALARLPAEVRDRYFEPPFHGEREIIDDLKESVSFGPANLMERATLEPQGQFDVIFCRNVLIYFDEAARTRAVENLYTALRPGGFVCLGHSESMTRISDRFKVRRFKDAIVYQRPEDGA
jgi:chemotaxis protein methyltransferase CheR